MIYWKLLRKMGFSLEKIAKLSGVKSDVLLRYVRGEIDGAQATRIRNKLKALVKMAKQAHRLNSTVERHIDVTKARKAAEKKEAEKAKEAEEKALKTVATVASEAPALAAQQAV